MKNQLVALAILFLFQTNETNAQGITYISNIGQPSTGSFAVGSNSLAAQWFYTGNNFAPGGGGYRLDSVQLLMNTPAGNPNSFSVSVHGASRNEGPGGKVGTLIGPEPASNGVFNYSVFNITLSPLSVYWIVVTSGTSSAQGSFSWNLADSSSYTSSGDWLMGSFYDSSIDGQIWTRNGNRPLQFAINATAVPEPSSLVLLCFSGLLFGAHLLRRAKVKT